MKRLTLFVAALAMGCGADPAGNGMDPMPSDAAAPRDANVNPSDNGPVNPDAATPSDNPAPPEDHQVTPPTRLFRCHELVCGHRLEVRLGPGEDPIFMNGQCSVRPDGVTILSLVDVPTFREMAECRGQICAPVASTVSLAWEMSGEVCMPCAYAVNASGQRIMSDGQTEVCVIN